MQSVSLVCRRFHYVIEERSELWQKLDFDTPLYFHSVSTLEKITTNRTFIHFGIPHATERIKAYEIDSFLSRALTASRKLTWLDITESQASTLHFLRDLQNLSVLIIDSCQNIADQDILVLRELRKLTQIYLGFTSVTAQGIISAVAGHQYLNTLECSGILFDNQSLTRLLESVPSLQFLTVSLIGTCDVRHLSKEYSVTLLVVR